MPDRKRVVAGVDGGATRTRAVIATSDGEILGSGTAGPSNYDNVGTVTAGENIREAVRTAMGSAARGSIALDSIFLGMAGVVSPADRETVKHMVLEHALAPENAITVDHDIRIALAGGLEGHEGIVLIAGTGSSAFGRRSDGRQHRTGWGYLLDDRGSGYSLGLQAMIATVMEADGRGERTELSTIVRSRLQLSDIDDILRLLYHPGMPVSDIASFAPEVIGAAERGDAVAKTILGTGARELARMVETVARRLSFAAGGAPLTMVGGLVEHAGTYRALVCEAILALLPGADIREAALPPVLGAVLLALESTGVGTTEPLLTRFRQFVF